MECPGQVEQEATGMDSEIKKCAYCSFWKMSHISEEEWGECLVNEARILKTRANYVCPQWEEEIKYR